MRHNRITPLLSGIALAAACGMMAMSACTTRSHNDAVPAQEEPWEAPATVMAAVDTFLVNEVAANYSQGDVCIPCPRVVATVDSADSVLVWGDFWVYNYTLAGDTLKMASGGSHQGLMHVRPTGDGGYMVTSFDQVTDGAGWERSAQEIFGEHFAKLQTIISDDTARERERAQQTADFVKQNGIKATCYQDYGWPAVALPL